MPCLVNVYCNVICMFYVINCFFNRFTFDICGHMQTVTYQCKFASCTLKICYYFLGPMTMTDVEHAAHKAFQNIAEQLQRIFNQSMMMQTHNSTVRRLDNDYHGLGILRKRNTQNQCIHRHRYWGPLDTKTDANKYTYRCQPYTHAQTHTQASLTSCSVLAPHTMFCWCTSTCLWFYAFPLQSSMHFMSRSLFFLVVVRIVSLTLTFGDTFSFGIHLTFSRTSSALCSHPLLTLSFFVCVCSVTLSNASQLP